MCSRRDDLEVEVSSVRKDLLDRQENINLLETEVCQWNTVQTILTRMDVAVQQYQCTTCLLHEKL